MSLVDWALYLGCWAIVALILAALCYGLDKYFPVDPEDNE